MEGSTMLCLEHHTFMSLNKLHFLDKVSVYVEVLYRFATKADTVKQLGVSIEKLRSAK